MSKKFAIPIDMTGLEIQNANFQNLSTAPSAPAAGRFYYDTVTNALMVYNGTDWISQDASKVGAAYIPLSKLATDPLARANHTGTQLASTISDFDTQVHTSSLSSLAVPSANVAWNAKKITGLADPTAAQDAATMNYVDTAVQSAAAGIDSKPSVRILSAANTTLSGLQTIDGVTTIGGDRVLCVGQTLGKDNGVYVSASGAWTRAVDADASAEMSPGAFWYVEEGTTYGGSQWRLATVAPIILGTTPLVINQFGASGSYTAGNGLQLTGSAFSVKIPASSGLVVDGTGTYIDTAIVVRKYGTLIGDGATTSIVVTHNLNTRDIDVSVVRASSPYDAVEVDVQATSVNTATLIFSVAPTSNQYRAVIMG
jgi:hypothetical protein